MEGVGAGQLINTKLGNGQVNQHEAFFKSLEFHYEENSPRECQRSALNCSRRQQKRQDAVSQATNTAKKMFNFCP